MIYVRIELWPGGDRSRAKLLTEALIHNTGGSDSVGEYRYQISKIGGFRATEGQLAACTPRLGRVLRKGEIVNFPRKRLYAVDLLCRVLQKAFGERN